MKTPSLLSLVLGTSLAFSPLAEASPEPEAAAAAAAAGGGKHHDHWPRKPLVSPKKLESKIRLRDLIHGEQRLQDFANAYPARNRVFGGEAHKDTVDWLYRELKATKYYDVYKQEQVHLWSKSDLLFEVNGEEHDSLGMTYAPSGDATADIFVVPNLGCETADFDGVEGKIALIERGECTFGDKSALAGASKAAAAVIYNNLPGDLAGTLGEPTNPLGPYVATLGITQEVGQEILAQAETETVSAHVWVETLFENRTTWNVIAETKGGNKNNVITLGGHTDSVEAGPGINDDGSGIISNLVVAKALTGFSVKNAVRFCFWTAEEFGLLGSQFYIDSLSEEERAKIKLYLNFDMIASPNYANMIYDGDGSAFNLSGPPGSAEIEKLFEKFYEDQKLPHTPGEFSGRSDYAAFIDAGIPSGGLFTGAEGLKTEEEARLFGGEAGVAYDVNYHAVGDDIDNLAHDAFLLNSKATAYAVATYAISTDSLPERTIAKRSVGREGKFNGYKGQCWCHRRCDW